MEGESRSCKRSRDESPELTDTKRFREADDIIVILDGVEQDTASHGLADVVKILQEDIETPMTEEVKVSSRIDLGYLLEASDDELGLPPAVGSTSCSTDGGNMVEVADDGAGFDRIWGFEDKFNSCEYEGLGFGIETEFDDGVIFNGGLFDCADRELDFLLGI